jgi:hypothetical protein
MNIEVSVGEIVDKLSILDIKRQKITDSAKLENVNREYLYLHEIVFADLNIAMSDYEQLVAINVKLWDIEDVLREMESRKQFDDMFVEYARQVYITNDLRADIKKQINLKYGSTFIEEKSYAKY